MEKVLFSLDSKTTTFKSHNFSEIEQGIGPQVGKNLKRYRQSKNLTQSQHARMMGVSVSQYRKYEAGTDLPKYHTLCRWGVVSCCSIYMMFDNTIYANHFPEPLTSWRFMPFHRVLGLLKPQPFLALINLVRSFGFIQEIILDDLNEPQGPSTDIDLAIEELEHQAYPTIAHNLQEFRRARQISQETMAELLGVTLNTYRSYENPQQAPKFSCLMAMRFLLVFEQHLSALMPQSQFAFYIRHKMHRMKFIAPFLYNSTPRQYKQIEQVFLSMESIAADDPLYDF